MKNLIIALFILSSTILTAQETITWKGGTPGNEMKWKEARNWSSQKVPNEFSLVIIKNCYSGHNAQPIIDHDVIVAQIEIHAGASLSVSNNATLIIDGEYTYSKGLVLYGGKIINNGYLVERNIDRFPKFNDIAQADIIK